MLLQSWIYDGVLPIESKDPIKAKKLLREAERKDAEKQKKAAEKERKRLERELAKEKAKAKAKEGITNIASTPTRRKSKTESDSLSSAVLEFSLLFCRLFTSDLGEEKRYYCASVDD